MVVTIGAANTCLAVQIGNHPLGLCPLPIVEHEDHRAVLCSHVVALPVQRRRVMGGKKHLQQLPIGDHRRVELHPHHLRVARSSGANLLIAGRLALAAHVAALHLSARPPAAAARPPRTRSILRPVSPSPSLPYNFRCLAPANDASLHVTRPKHPISPVTPNTFVVMNIR